MKYTININQKAWQEHYPDMNFADAAVCLVVKDLCNSASEKIQRKTFKERIYTFISLAEVSRQLPMMNWKSRNGASQSIKKLCEAGLFIKHHVKGKKMWLCPTDELDKLAYSDFAKPSEEITDRHENVTQPSRKRDANRHENVTDYNTNNSNTKTKNYYKEKFFEEESIRVQLITTLNQKYYRTGLEIEMEKFINYWTEEDSKGREKWKTCKTFDPTKRFNTWVLNALKYGNVKKID